METKNLGQVAGLWIGTYAPINTTLIWYDSTAAIQCHKVYDFESQTWTVLNNSTVSSITYAELRTLAIGAGLTIGSWYKMTDRGNSLALAITPSKVQYVDAEGNLTIDDLTSDKTYIVTSNNLYIDDIQGVFDAVNKVIRFSFDEDVSVDGTDFVFGKKRVYSSWKLIKMQFKNLISAVSGNSITWNDGMFFNFQGSLNAVKDAEGGVVSKEVFDTAVDNMTQSVTNVSNLINQEVQSAKDYADAKTGDSNIYDKALPSAPIAGARADILTHDTLLTIVNKCQRWFSSLKFSSGIMIDRNFAAKTNAQNIGNADTVQSAFEKVQYYINDSKKVIKTLMAYDIVVRTATELNNLPETYAAWKTVNPGSIQPSILIACGNCVINFTAEKTIWCDMSELPDLVIEFAPGSVFYLNPVSVSEATCTLFNGRYNAESWIPLITINGNGVRIFNNNNDYVVRAFYNYNGIDSVDLSGNCSFHGCKNLQNCYGSYSGNGEFNSFNHCMRVRNCFGTFFRCERVENSRGYVHAETYITTSIGCEFYAKNNDVAEYAMWHTPWGAPVGEVSTPSDSLGTGWNSRLTPNS